MNKFYRHKSLNENIFTEMLEKLEKTIDYFMKKIPFNIINIITIIILINILLGNTSSFK